jgi:hypothetical protein
MKLLSSAGNNKFEIVFVYTKVTLYKTKKQSGHQEQIQYRITNDLTYSYIERF